MTWTDELIFFLFPRDGTAQMGTNGSQNKKLILLVLGYVYRLFGYHLAPTIALFDLNDAHDRLRQRRELANRSY